MSGSLTTPNTFATQSGNVPASELDDNWSAHRTYINAREITFGTIATRPAAGTSGRYFFATDVNGGTFYGDTGSAWQQLATGLTSTLTAIGSYSIRRLQGSPNAGAPSTQYDISGDLAVLRQPSDSAIVVRTGFGTLTNDITQPSTANGRDQAGAFTPATFIHFYLIWNGTTVATLSSATAPTTGPTLPTGYTHWAYVGPVFLQGDSTLRSTSIQGTLATYDSQVTLVNDLTGANGVVNGIVTTDLVPTNSARLHLVGIVSTAAGSASADSATLRVRGTNNFASFPNDGAAAGVRQGYQVIAPNTGSMTWVMTHAGTSPKFSLFMNGYTIPNGAD